MKENDKQKDLGCQKGKGRKKKHSLEEDKCTNSSGTESSESRCKSGTQTENSQCPSSLKSGNSEAPPRDMNQWLE
ncbi:unnamed protein product [Caenorhabditis bovis]|uniref:Uncharacterized protein n=1 Tax=Caenorhabditis bovis TaxID=2654633 RepID=A0A8S1ET59_9PELO|nr:unnamed protein product [Caenorhabditis bovis]